MRTSHGTPKSEWYVKKNRFHYIVLVLIPVSFFALLEGGLRLSGYGDTYPLFAPVPGYEQFLVQNKDVARRYFGPRSATVPSGLNDVFRAEKDSTILRIFVQGGSSAAGYPYYYGGSFSRMLEQRLQQTYPEREVEVINTALAAVNSYTLLDFVDEIIKQEPDVVLIYAGHNEFYGALGVGSTESLGRFPFVVRSFLALRTYRTLRLMQDFVTSIADAFRSNTVAPPGRTLMERMVGEQKIPYRSTLYRMGIHQFEENIDRLLKRYAQHNISVILGTVASNEGDQPPFISETAFPELQNDYDELVLAGTELASRSIHDTAIQKFSAAIELDSIGASAYFERAKSYRYLRQIENAVRDFRAARDRDQLRFRAPGDINNVLRALADRHGSVIAESHAALSSGSPDGIIGSELILEHLHPNVNGYFILSDVFYNTLLDSGVLPEASERIDTPTARKEVLLTAVDDKYGMLRVRQLKGSWPFQAPGTVDRSIDTMSAVGTIDSLALAVFRSEIRWYEATQALREFYLKNNNLPLALQASMAMIQQYPFLPTPYAYAGEVLARMGRLTESGVYLDVALDIESSVSVLIARGNLSVIQGDPGGGLAFFNEALKLDPDSERARELRERLLSAKDNNTNPE